MTSSNKPSHLRALLRKNWITWKRSLCVSCLEILVPVFFALIIVAFRSALSKEDVPTKVFYDDPNESFHAEGVLDGFVLSNYMKNCNADKNGGKVALAPSSSQMILDLEQEFLSNNFQTILFANDQEINDYTSRMDYARVADVRLCFGIVLTKDDEADQYEYHLRFNTSSFADPDIPDTELERVNRISWQNLESFKQFRDRGFLLVQNLVDNYIIRKANGNDNSFTIKSHIASRTLEAYTQDDLAANLKGQTRLFLDLPLLLPYLRFMNGILREKEKKIREGMKIMGLRNSAFYLSWFITYFIIFTIISLLVTIALTRQLFSNSSFGLVFLWHWEFSLCLMAMGFFITVFFSKAKVGNVAGFVITLLCGFLQSTVSNTSPSSQLFGVSFAPQTSVGLGADQILLLESVQLGLTSNTVNLEVQGYKMIFHYVVMLLDILIFIILGAYLDQVLPHDTGIRKHPLFCIMRRKKYQKQNSRIQDDGQSYLLDNNNQTNFEDVAPALKAQDQNNESIQVQGLRKVFSNKKVAVDGVSFSMYKSQIFSLLGHNGAGKTTTISMITGMFESTEGTTKVFGLDVGTDLEEIRKTMGVCPQHDILFDDLTVKEHLEMYAVFKGVDKKDIPAEVEKIIEDIGLAEKRDYRSKNLSGGQKRKLSIGIAFIGGSKFIVLDEPSSGMDTSARRKLWDMLKNYKHNRIVLLTTHFMDEADYLGDRIGIMADGKLKCLGSSLFLKAKFGIGYNLTMVKEDINDPSQPIKDLIQKHVPEGKVLSDVSAELSYQLPLESAPKFKGLFDDLDQNLKKLKISNYGISVTTLEEVFLNVAKIEAPEKHFHKEEGSPNEIKQKDLDDYDIKEHRITGAWATFSTHFAALTKKRIQYFKRDKKGLVCELFMPILMIVAGVLIAKSAFGRDYPPIALTDDLYGYEFQVNHNEIVPVTSQPIDPNFISALDNAQDFNLVSKTQNNLADFSQEVLNDQGKDLINSPVNVFSVFMTDYSTTSKVFDYTAFIDTRAQEASAFAQNKINSAILQATTGKTISLVISPFKGTTGTEAIDTAISGIVYAFVFAIGMSFIPASLITFIVKEREVNAKHQQLVSGVSITAYWFSNFFVDYLKYLFPAIINALLAMAMDASALVEGDKLKACWLIFLLYGLSVIPFVYLMSFLFKDYGTAQIAAFFFNFGSGFIGGIAVSILRIFPDTRSVAKTLQWILRPLPTFSMTYGFLNLANRDAYDIFDNQGVSRDPLDINLAGGDCLYMIITSIVFFIAVFVVEKLRNKRSLSSILTRESSVPYVPQKLDSDVEREMKEIEKSDNKTYTIKVDKLRKVFSLGGGKHKVAVDRLSFGVKNGECFALLGVNGAGKTTTFKILSGDYVQTSGKAYINGYEIPQEIAQARQNIGYCPQFDSILELLTAKEHLYLYAAIKGIPVSMRDRIVEKHLREMNLKQYENIPAGTYSGGNKRKLCVAIAIIGNPAVVFLDEPSTGMDPEARRFMWNIISRISRERKQSSIILTTHSMEEAEALATKMGIMVNGNLKCLGTSQHIKGKYGGGYEIEVKLEQTPKQEVTQVLQSLQLKPEQSIDKAKVEEILEKLQARHLKKEIHEEGTGSAIYAELKKGNTSSTLLLEWILIEQSGQRLKDFLNQNFGEMTILEHFQSFYRFRTVNNITVGNFFGLLEANKTKLNILQYSIKQATIEQIFNSFAAEDENLKKDGETAIDLRHIRS